LYVNDKLEEDDGGKAWGRGVYYQLVVSGHVETSKMSLIK
jgi:hypothetical protein